jgi:transposase InsO family protein
LTAESLERLADLFVERGLPDYIRSDNGPEFAAKQIRAWLERLGVSTLFIEPGSPWENGVAKRWIGSCRRELLDHIIAVSEAHVRRLIGDYISYCHADRIHDSLEKDTPAMRIVSSKPDRSARLVSLPRIGGLYHRYDWQQAA